jgi:hypothetical protein
VTGHRTFTRQTEPTAEVIYGRRILAEAAALIRDGQVGGNPEGLTTHEATRARAEIAEWFDMFAATLKSVTPTSTHDYATRRRHQRT